MERTWQAENNIIQSFSSSPLIITTPTDSLQEAGRSVFAGKGGNSLSSTHLNTNMSFCNSIVDETQHPSGVAQSHVFIASSLAVPPFLASCEATSVGLASCKDTSVGLASGEATSVGLASGEATSVGLASGEPISTGLAPTEVTFDSCGITMKLAFIGKTKLHHATDAAGNKLLCRYVPPEERVVFLRREGPIIERLHDAKLDDVLPFVLDNLLERVVYVDNADGSILVGFKPLSDTVGTLNKYMAHHTNGSSSGYIMSSGLQQIKQLYIRLHIFQQIVQTVVVCHNSGIAVRNISPDSVLVFIMPDSKGRSKEEVTHTYKVVLTDYSESLMDFDCGCGSGVAGMFHAPEMKSVGTHDAFAADMFALGCLLRMLMTGVASSSPVVLDDYLFAHTYERQIRYCIALMRTNPAERLNSHELYEMLVDKQYHRDESIVLPRAVKFGLEPMRDGSYTNPNMNYRCDITGSNLVRMHGITSEVSMSS